MLFERESRCVSRIGVLFLRELEYTYIFQNTNSDSDQDKIIENEMITFYYVFWNDYFSISDRIKRVEMELKYFQAIGVVFSLGCSFLG